MIITSRAVSRAGRGGGTAGLGITASSLRSISIRAAAASVAEIVPRAASRVSSSNWSR